MQRCCLVGQPMVKHHAVYLRPNCNQMTAYISGNLAVL
jgi:hypothetical protein